MTLSASFPISASQINVELGRSAGDAFDIQGGQERWLGQATGAISMSDFLGRTAVLLTDTVGPSAGGTSHSFAGVNFGPSFTNRRIICYVFGQSKGAGVVIPATVPITGFTVGGVSSLVAGPLNFYYWTGLDASTIFAGVQSDVFNPAGTSGTVSFTTGQQMQCSISVWSVLNVNHADAVTTGTFGAGLPLTINATIPTTNVIGVAAVQNSGATLGFSGTTKVFQWSHVAGYQCAIGFDHPVAAGARNTTITGAASGAAAMLQDVWTV